jgi:hypothetical protein
MKVTVVWDVMSWKRFIFTLNVYESFHVETKFYTHTKRRYYFNQYVSTDTVAFPYRVYNFSNASFTLRSRVTINREECYQTAFLKPFLFYH